MGSTKIIDGDGHVLEDGSIAKYLHFPYKERADRLQNRLFPPLDHLHAGQAPSQTPPGSFQRVDANGWVDFLDTVGIETTVLYPTSGLACGKINNHDWAIAITRAYNDWLHETFLSKSPRLKGMGLIPMQEPEAAVEELKRLVQDLGMCGAMMPSTGLPSQLGSKEYWPIYREADRLGCCLAVHGGCHSGLGLDNVNVHAAVHGLGHPFGITISFASIIFNGILDRFPNTNIAFLEGGVAWFLVGLERFDRSYETHYYYNPRGDLLTLKPNEKVSDYIIRQVKAGRIYVGCEGDEPALAYAVKVVGSEPFLYSSDFPHEVNTETCMKEIQELVDNGELTEEAKGAVLHENSRRFYGL